jgi:hypothetical protein
VTKRSALALSGATAVVAAGLLLAPAPSPSPAAPGSSVVESSAPESVRTVEVREKGARPPAAEAKDRVATLATGLARTLAPSAPTIGGPTSEAEPGLLRERLPGERLTLDHRARSLATIERLLAAPLEDSERAELERRKAILEAKQREQASRVARIEERIAILERP